MSIFPVAWTTDLCQMLLSYINKTYTESPFQTLECYTNITYIYFGDVPGVIINFTYIFFSYLRYVLQYEKNICHYCLVLYVIVCLLIHFCTSIIYLLPYHISTITVCDEIIVISYLTMCVIFILS